MPQRLALAAVLSRSLSNRLERRKMNRSGTSAGLVGAAILLSAGIASATTYTVTSSADAGAGTLRQAIIDANTSLGPDTIAFNIVGSGVHTIVPVTLLPPITDAVTIDGYTQPGSSRRR